MSSRVLVSADVRLGESTQADDTELWPPHGELTNQERAIAMGRKSNAPPPI
jgi:hypothetical protein